MAYLDANNDFDEINGRLDSYYACMASLSLKCNFGSTQARLKSMFIRLDACEMSLKTTFE